MRDVTRGVRWGVRGTLRGGEGTPREKADLLVDLYERAGFEAELLTGGDPLSEDQVKKLFWRSAVPTFDPDISQVQLDAWNDELGLEDQPDIERPDPDGSERASLAETLVEQLPPQNEWSLSPFDFRWGTGQLVVRVVADGEERYANLFDLAVPFGEAGVDVSRLAPAPAAEVPPDVEVTLEAASANTPDEPFDLVSGTWSVEELVGRQLLVQTLSGVDVFDQPGTRFRDVRSFVPALTVQGVDLTPEQMQTKTVMGDPVTRSADRLQVAQDGTVFRNGDPLVTPTSSTDAEAVASLDVTADPTRYPEVKLSVDALDSGGVHVGGLPATAFGIADEDEPLGFEMRANEAAPRIRILSDESGSMPIEYRGEEMTATVESIRGAIRNDHPKARIHHQFTQSQLWTRLGEAAATDANVVVYITDGQVNDKMTDEIQTVLENGPPVVLINVYDEVNRHVQSMADLSGGVQIPVSDTDTAIQAIVEYVEEAANQFPTYIFSYGAPSNDRSERTATVSLPDAGISGETTYDPPAEPISPPHLSGLYLTVKIGRREVTRTLAGWNPALDYRKPVTQAMLDDVAGALFGDHILSFEAGAPPLSVWTDDFLAAKRSVADLDAALVSGDEEAIQDAKASGLLSIPPEVFLLAAPLPDAVTEDSLTFQDNVRVTLSHDQPVFGADHISSRGDILPLTRYNTAVDDPAEGFMLTLERTAYFAAVEATVFETTTETLLAGKTLKRYRSGQTDLDPTEDYRWRLFTIGSVSGARDFALFPVGGDPYVFWNIDYQTGAVVGILPDGSGGGSAEQKLQEHIAEYDRVVSMYNLLVMGVQAVGALGGPGGFALGIVAAYGQMLARIYAAAGLAIAIMDASGLGKAIAIALAKFACQVAKSIFFAAMGDSIWPGLENLIGAMGGSTPISCPG